MYLNALIIVDCYYTMTGLDATIVILARPTMPCIHLVTYVYIRTKTDGKDQIKSKAEYDSCGLFNPGLSAPRVLYLLEFTRNNILLLLEVCKILYTQNFYTHIRYVLKGS